MENYYQLLGLDDFSSAEEVNKAVKRLSMEFHPDSNPDDPNAKETQQNLNEARRILTHADKKIEYDQELCLYKISGGVDLLLFPRLRELLKETAAALISKNDDSVAVSLRKISEYICKHYLIKTIQSGNRIIEKKDLKNLSSVIQMLRNKGTISEDMKDTLFQLRLNNAGAHEGLKADPQKVKNVLELLPKLLNSFTDFFLCEDETKGTFEEIAVANGVFLKETLGPNDPNYPWHLAASQEPEKKGSCLPIVLILAGLLVVYFIYTTINSVSSIKNYMEKDFEEDLSEILAKSAESDPDNNHLVNVSSAEASSTLSGSNDYGVWQCLDGDPATSWQEGEPGWGEGCTLTFEFEKIETLAKIKIWNGCGLDEEHFNGDGRVKNITVEYGNKTESFNLEDVNEYQTITLPSTENTKLVTITINSVYEGSKWEDTAISEIAFVRNWS